MIKTIISYDIEEFDEQVNEFESTHLVFATQTHTTYMEASQKCLFTAVIFHRGLRNEAKA